MATRNFCDNPSCGSKRIHFMHFSAGKPVRHGKVLSVCQSVCAHLGQFETAYFDMSATYDELCDTLYSGYLKLSTQLKLFLFRSTITSTTASTAADLPLRSLPMMMHRRISTQPLQRSNIDSRRPASCLERNARYEFLASKCIMDLFGCLWSHLNSFLLLLVN